MIWQPSAAELPSRQIPPTAPVISSERITIDFSEAFSRRLDSLPDAAQYPDPVQRQFYFEQAPAQRWSKENSGGRSTAVVRAGGALAGHFSTGGAGEANGVGGDRSIRGHL